MRPGTNSLIEYRTILELKKKKKERKVCEAGVFKFNLAKFAHPKYLPRVRK